MKKVISLFALGLVALSLVGCGNKKAEDTGAKSKDNVVTVGASPTPHAEILEHIKPKLEKEGIQLEIKKFDDYVMPNKALEQGEIDANYFQHIPYFELAVKENDFDFKNAGKVHIELMAFYSKTIKDVKDVKDGATVLVSNSESDWGRVITILQDAGLVTVKDGVDLETATFEDIDENPKHLKFSHNVNAELLPTAYDNEEADLIAINANFANGIGLSPEKDGVFIEKDNSPYANIVAVQSKDKDNKNIKKLMEALHDKETQEWITKKWDGKIKPVSK